MRAFHLTSLLQAGAQERPVFPSGGDRGPLVIPWWFSARDAELVLVFCEQLHGLRRVAVDWYRTLGRVDLDYLRRTWERHGAEASLVVVQVHGEGVRLEDVMGVAELQRFEHVAVTSDLPLEGEVWGRLRALTGLVAELLERRAGELVTELSMPGGGLALLEAIKESLFNPVVLVEAYNALFDVDAERLAALGERAPSLSGDPIALEAARRDAIYRRVLGRLLDDLPPRVLVALGAVTARGAHGLDGLGESADLWKTLRDRMLVRDERLVGWARWLETPTLQEVLTRRLEALAKPEEPLAGASEVLDWLQRGTGVTRAASAETGSLDEVGSPDEAVRRRVLDTFQWLHEGRLERARNELVVLESLVASPLVTNETRGGFWHAVGRVRLAERQWYEAEQALRQAVRLFQGVSSSRLGVAQHDLVAAIAGQGRL